MSWHRKEFKIALTYGESKMVYGWVSDDGLWGVYKGRAKQTDINAGWVITHLSTGMTVRGQQPTLSYCKAVCDKLSDRPQLWNFGVLGDCMGWTKRARKIRSNLVDKALQEAA